MSANEAFEPLLRRVFMFLEDEEWEHADEYCERVLDINPECAEAYLGKLMAELQVKSRKQLEDCAEPFDGRDNYKKIIRFGDEKLETEMRGYITHINERNENARLTGIYSNAQNIMRNPQSEDEYKRAAKKRKKIIAITTPIVCVCIAVVIVLNTVIIPKQKLNKALSLLDSGDYDSAYALLEEIGNSEAIASSKYDRAMALIDSGDYDSAYALLEEIGNSEAIASSKYDRAMALIDLGDYDSAYMLLKNLDYKDSDEKVNKILAEHPNYKFKLANVGDIVTFGAYEQDNNTFNGKEDIEWLVLAKEDNNLLIISDKALDCQQYNTSYNFFVTWETCSLRKWMNSTFLNNAFSAEEQAQIQSTTVSADKNPEYSTSPGNATTDKIFLLSIEEVEKYFSADEDRKCVPTEYAIAQGAWTPDSYTKGGVATCWWWLWSSGYDLGSAAYVTHVGSVYYFGTDVNFGEICVRPAMWISLK